MASLLQYDARSVAKFKRYFKKPVAKRGRPKKRKRGRPKKKSQCKNASPKKQCMLDNPTNASSVIDLTTKKQEQLDARLEGDVALIKLAKCGVYKHINWDTPRNKVYRNRIAKSWTTRTDIYREGDSFKRFCTRTVIDRGVLSRFLKNKYKQNVPEKKRGRRTLLPMSVMRHICEGAFMCMMCLRIILIYLL